MSASTVDRIRLRAAAITVAWFVVAVFLPLVDKLVHVDPAPKVDELRAYAGFPRPYLLATGDVRGFTSRFERWFDDHFGFRNSLLRGAAWLRTIVFRSPANADVVLGDDGWLYYGGLPQRNSRGLEPWSECDLERWRFGLEGWNDYCAILGAKLIVALIPDKQEIHPEHLPARERRIGKETRTDQIIRHMKESGSPVDLLDLRVPLRAAREGGDVFQKADTHWNARGARAGYDALIAHIARVFPAVEPVPESETRFFPFADGTGDLARMLCLESLSHDVPGALVADPRRSHSAPYPPPASFRGRVRTSGTYVATTGITSLPHAVFFRDSFTTPLESLLPESFERCVFVSIAEPAQRVPFEPEFVATERPELVVVLSVDRYLVGPPPDQVARIGGAFDDDARRARFRVVGEDSIRNGFSGLSAENPTTRFELGAIATLHADDDDPFFLAPCPPVPRGKRVRVDVALECPAASVLEVFTRLPDSGRFDAADVQRVPTRAGWNRVRIYLPPTGSGGALRIDPGIGKGDFGIARVEVAVEE